MIHKNDIAKLAKQILHPRPKFRSTRLINPRREWTIGLLSALFGLATIAVWSSQLYFKYQEASVDEPQRNVELVTVYREGLVEAALEQYVQRQERFDSLMSNTGAAPDVEAVAVEGNEAGSNDEVVATSSESGMSPAEEEAGVTETASTTDEELIIDIVIPDDEPIESSF